MVRNDADDFCAEFPGRRRAYKIFESGTALFRRARRENEQFWFLYHSLNSSGSRGRNRSFISFQTNFFILRMPDHEPLDIVECPASFLPRIQDIVRIEYAFCFREKRRHFLSEQERQVGRSDDAVVMLAGRRAAVPYDELVNLRSKVEDYFAIFGAREIHKGNDMEISVADVSRYRVEDAAFFEERDEFGKEARVGIGINDEVVNEWGSVKSAEIFPEKGETFAPHLPIFLGGALVLCNARFDRQISEHALCLLRFFERRPVRVLRELCKEDEFRHAISEHHEDFGKEGDAETRRRHESHLTEYLGKEAY